MKTTFIGMATVLLEIGGTRILTDPVLDPKGSAYKLGKSGLVRYVNEAGPALPSAELGDVDIALVSHDQHKDNLDRSGREFLKSVGDTVTTTTGAARLKSRHGISTTGLKPWQHHDVTLKDGSNLRITATPARHGPPVIAPLVAGPVIGFLLEWPGFKNGSVYLTGDTRLYSGVNTVARKFTVGTVMINLGAGQFSATGSTCYSMTAKEGVECAKLFPAAKIVPLHFEGWSHLSQSRADVEQAFAIAGMSERLIWLEPGQQIGVAA
ncbi:MBL fold metallo-hydrolase [uncultured Litoreibacter sp.]|uniref:MBL fold metallo-hydrolase n=1 Tax=uncultured Litoreibacter sp. TaxID=1392394 RepID=UPI002616E8B4|nr:MBL fold metallo-hydrolase [uncultured Litoreibacter sp.]